MTGKTMLGLVVLAIGLSTIPAFAESETIILSPYQQFKNGTPINEIQCKDSKILMESPRNTPACVNENSVEKLEDKGYIILYPLQTDFKDNSESSETALLDNKIDMMISENANSSNDIQTKYIYTNDKSTGGHGYQGFTRTPLYSLEIPNSINVGETVSINYTLSWFNPDGTSILDGIIDEEERYDIVNTNVGIVIPDEFTVLNEDKTFFKTFADQYTPHTATWYEFNEGYSTELISGSIDVRLDKEMMYELDRFSVPLGGKPHFLVVQKTEDGIVLRELSSFTDKSDIYTISTMTSMTRGEENGRYDVLYLQDVPHIPEFRTAQQTFNEPQENIYIDKDWEGFAEYLRFAIDVENITDVREWLINTAKTSEKFVDDFFKVYPEFDDRAISENANSSNDIQTKYIYTNDKSTGGHGYQGFTRTPLYSLEIPNSINVGETVSINYTLSWFNPDGSSILDGIIDEEERYDIVNSNVGIVIPDEFTVLNEDKTFFKTYADQYTPHTATWYEFNEGYSTELISGSIDVRLDKEMMYDLDQFTVFIGGEHQGLITQKTDDGIVLRERSSFTDKSDIYTINTMGAMFGGEENGRYDVRYLQDVPHIPEFRTAQQTFNEPQENIYIDKDWEGFAEYLRFAIDVENITDVREWLINTAKTSEKFVDDFFKVYPEFAETQANDEFTRTISNSPTTFLVRGNYFINDRISSMPLVDVLVCAFDENLTDNSKQLLYNGLTPVCDQTDSSGFFTMFGINDDPDDSTFVDLVLVMSLQNENVKSVYSVSDVIISYTPPNTINNISQPILNVNTLFAPRIYSICYNDFTALNTAHTFFDDELNYDIPFVTLEEDSDRTVYCEGSDCGSIQDRIKLRDIGDPIVVVHEYGHHIQHKLYQSIDGEIPPCDSHFYSRVSSPSCSWAEGFAWFVPALVSDSPTFTLTTGNVEFNLEDGTFGHITPTPFPSSNVEYSEGLVASALWDIYDSTNESGDNISNNLMNIWDAFNDSPAQNIR